MAYTKGFLALAGAKGSNGANFFRHLSGRALQNAQRQRDSF
jgi:hypothetical protein